MGRCIRAQRTYTEMLTAQDVTAKEQMDPCEPNPNRDFELEGSPKAKTPTKRPLSDENEPDVHHEEPGPHQDEIATIHRPECEPDGKGSAKRRKLSGGNGSGKSGGRTA